MMITAVTVFLFAVTQVYGHTYHMGKCPEVTPVKNFDIDNFLGKWYVIQKTKTRSSCVFNDYIRDPENPEHFKIEQVSDNILGLASEDQKYHYTGDLMIPDPNNAGAMSVKFPLNLAGGASYVVFATDYKNYAGVFTCQKLAFAHRRSVTILSRERTLKPEYVDKLRNMTAKFGIDPEDLSIIKHENCTEPAVEAVEPTIKEKVSNTFRKVVNKTIGGENLQSNAEFLKPKTKARPYASDISPELDDYDQDRNMNQDAEWLP